MPPIRFRRIRFTISAMMALIVGIAILITLVLPLVRFGKPICLTTGQTARWLLTSPGYASCTNCHARSPGRRPAETPCWRSVRRPKSCPLVRSGSATNSCTSCHINPRTTSKLLPTN